MLRIISSQMTYGMKMVVHRLHFRRSTLEDLEAEDPDAAVHLLVIYLWSNNTHTFSFDALGWTKYCWFDEFQLPFLLLETKKKFFFAI